MNKNLKRILGGGVILVGLLGASVFASNGTELAGKNIPLKREKASSSRPAMVRHIDKSSLSEEELEALKEKFALRKEEKKSKTTSGDSALEENTSDTSSKKERKQKMRKHSKEELQENADSSLNLEENSEKTFERGRKGGKPHSKMLKESTEESGDVVEHTRKKPSKKTTK